jgi:hypothetical protein
MTLRVPDYCDNTVVFARIHLITTAMSVGIRKHIGSNRK